jgi:microcystin-dependent protein
VAIGGTTTESGSNGAATGNNAHTTNLTTDPSNTGISINNAGGGAAHSIMPPTIVLPFILRVI